MAKNKKISKAKLKKLLITIVLLIVVALAAKFLFGEDLLPGMGPETALAQPTHEAGADVPPPTKEPVKHDDEPADEQPASTQKPVSGLAAYAPDPLAIPEYTGTPYYVLNNNEPAFKDDEITTEAFEFFSELDDLKRCGMTMACVGQELMPTEDRESISHVKPSGWVNVPYDFVDGRYLYNRSHLIGFQLTGENDNKLNLITGTRYFNVEGMLPFENMVADYVKETNNHVMYRVTPLYVEDELVCRGVQMEAWSVEDEGEGLCYNVYVYNVQPGVIIDYATGKSQEDTAVLEGGETGEYVLNTSSKKFHLPDCSGATNMKKDNRQEFEGSRGILIAQGFIPCTQCGA